MPRPRFSNWTVATNVTIAGGATGIFVLDLIDTFYPQIMVKATYATTGGVAGLQGRLYPGFITATNGNAEFGSLGTETIEYVDNYDSIPDFVTYAPTLNSGTTQTIRIGFDLDAEQYPRFLKLWLFNSDPTNPVVVSIYGDR